jgi:formamidopyrimidine-DNA glycosylase
MPELPDVVVYVEHLERRLIGATFEGARIVSLNLLRTAVPPLDAAFGRCVAGVRRIGKRIAIELDDHWFLVFHLMIAGRFHWRDAAEGPAPRLSRNGLAELRFSTGTLTLTEASKRQRASLHVVAGEAALREHERGGVEPLEVDRAGFAAALRRENHTLKRALTDPTLFSGIGNAYSDEILHRARLSPLQWTSRLSDDEVARLYDATRESLAEWVERLRAHYAEAFPEKVTAFRPEMAVHGKHGEPCPVCGEPVQRIVYADNETNYCARCQTEGRLLADRSLSRLLKSDWPRTLEELEERREARRAGRPK